MARGTEQFGPGSLVPRLILSGSLTSFADQLTLVALSLYVFFQFDSIVAVAFLLGTRSAAGVVGLALRALPRRLASIPALVGLDLVRAALTVAMLASLGSLPGLVVLFFLHDVVGTLQASARMPLLSQGAAHSERQAVNALDVTAAQLMRMSGALAAALLFDLDRIATLLLIVAGGFVLAAVLLLAPLRPRLPALRPAASRVPPPPRAGDPGELRLLTLGNSLVSASIALFAVGIIPHLAARVADPEAVHATLQASQFAGLALTGLAISTGRLVLSDRAAIVAGNAFLGLTVVLIAQLAFPPALVVLGLLYGLFNMASNSGARARLMALATREALGGYMQTRIALGAVAGGTAALAAGAAIDGGLVLATHVVALSGLGFAAYAAAYALKPTAISLEREDATERGA